MLSFTETGKAAGDKQVWGEKWRFQVRCIKLEPWLEWWGMWLVPAPVIPAWAWRGALPDSENLSRTNVLGPSCSFALCKSAPAFPF